MEQQLGIDQNIPAVIPLMEESGMSCKSWVYAAGNTMGKVSFLIKWISLAPLASIAEERFL
jgi:hypothetical protein